jgi:hypothetical protein
MPKFLQRLDDRGIAYRLHNRRTKGDAHVRLYWFRNIDPVPQEPLTKLIVRAHIWTPPRRSRKEQK